MNKEQFKELMYAIHKLDITMTNTNKLLDKLLDKGSNKLLNEITIGSHGITPSDKSTK